MSYPPWIRCIALFHHLRVASLKEIHPLASPANIVFLFHPLRHSFAPVRSALVSIGTSEGFDGFFVPGMRLKGTVDQAKD